MEIQGTGILPRKASGNAYVYEKEDFSFEEESDKSVEKEKERFESALEEAREKLEKEAEQTEQKTGGDEADILRAQIKFLEDPQIKSNVEDELEEGYTAEKAVKEGFKQPIKQLKSQQGRMAERANDLKDIRDRLIRILLGIEEHSLEELPENSIVVAENLKPSDTSRLNEENVEGIVTAKGSRTSHVAILSKSMGIPAVVGAEEIGEIEDGEQLLVNGLDGKVIVDPSEEKMNEIEQDKQVEVIQERVSTEDGNEVEVAANVANAQEVEQAAENGADGIGLYRTEFMFLERENSPGEEEHLENYRDALNRFSDDKIVVRTMDIGGDKPVPYLDIEESNNPFLGKRGIRLAFEEAEELFETQIKALLRAATTENGDNLAVMFPMIATLDEFEKAREKVEEMKQELEEEGKEYAEPEIGLMIETPSAVQIAGELAEKADFLSIGTNDLTQYTMAASRTDSQVSELQNPLHPSVIRSIKQTVEKGHENDAWVGMCGEMAGNPRLTELLIGLGLDELSMSSGVIPEIKDGIKQIDTKKAEETAEEALEKSKREGVQEVIGE